MIAQRVVDALISGDPDKPELPLGPSIDVPQSLVAQIASKVVRDYMDSREHGKAIYDHSTHDHGIMYSDYFQGVSTVYTRWDDVYTGTGENAHEALDEALGDAAQDGWDVRSVKNEFDPESPDNVQNSIRANNPDLEDDDDTPDGVYYYVSIFVRGVPGGVEEAKEPGRDVMAMLGKAAIQAGKKWLTVGESVSEGTMNSSHLFQAYLDTLESVDKASANEFRMEHKDELTEFQDGTIDGESLDHLVFDVLDPILSKYCLPYTYFGSHPGNGSDIGCWPLYEEMEYDSRNEKLTKFIAGTVEAIQFSEGRLPVGTNYVWIHNNESGQDSMWDAPRKKPLWHY